MRKILVGILVIIVFLTSFASYRLIVNTITVKSDGSGTWEMYEEIHGPIAEVYKHHNDVLIKTMREKGNTPWKQFRKELSKTFYQLYGTTPDIRSFKVVNFSSNKSFFKRTVVAEISGGLLGYEKKYEMFTFSRKSYKSTKDLYSYIETFLDDKFFQTMFMESRKDEKEIQTEIVTKVYLPLPRKYKAFVYFPYQKNPRIQNQ